MGTQSNLYIEKKDGSYIGVYCHYDGYPEHMIEQIEHCSHNELYEQIIIAGTKGGYRLFSPKTGESEFLEDSQPCYIYDPDDDGQLGINYLYVKYLDGTIRWRECMSDKWHIEKEGEGR